MVKQKTRRFRKKSNRKTKSQRGGDLGVISPFLAIIAVCAAVSTSNGLDMSAMQGEFGNVANNVKNEYNKAQEKMKEQGKKLAEQAKAQQAKLQPEANLANIK